MNEEMSNEPDLASIQIAAEQLVREEYEAAFDRVEKMREEHQRVLDQWKRIEAHVRRMMIEEGKVDPDTLPDDDAVMLGLMEIMSETYQLKKMFKLINENEFLKSQWNKLVMSIRLAGGDENEDDGLV